MEILRDSIRMQEEDKMMKRLTLLQQQVGYPLDTLINDEFIQKISEESFVWIILSKKFELLTGQRVNKNMIVQQELYKNITFGMFVDECFSAILHLHLQITDYKFNLQSSQDSIRTLKQQISLMESNTKLKYDQPNRLSICYIRHKSLKTDIFNHYQIKYKANINEQEQKSIYSKGDDLTCSFPILDQSKTLIITIWGKKKDNGTEFQILNAIEIELTEIYMSTALQTYSKEQIQPCILTIDYQDESLDAPFIGKNPIELQFSLSMASEYRIKLMKELKLRQEDLENYYKQEIEYKNSLIQSIIQPFNDLIYIPGDDLKNKNEPDPSRFSCSACKIF